MLIGRILVLGASLLIAAPTFSQVSIQETKLTASDAAYGDAFGYSVALAGDTAVVGAFQDDHAGGSNAGSAYVFVRSGSSWIEQAKLTAADGAGGGQFGYSIALSGDTAVVGGLGYSAYVFVRNGTTWSQQAKLTASDAGAPTYFGYSVALSGDTAVVGAYTGGSNAGSAFVFVRSGTSWSQQAKLTASDAAPANSFGYSVGLAGDTAIVSGVSGTGAAYIFERRGTGWSQEAKLTASDAMTSDSFGVSVALSGDTAIVGANGDDTAGGTSAGSAYVFVRTGTSWSQQAKLTASDATMYAQFGVAVALSDDRAVVGAYGDDTTGGTNAGTAYVFVRTGTSWIEQAKLTASDAATTNDAFGGAVALSGDTAVVGAYGGGGPFNIDGSAYVYTLPPAVVGSISGVVISASSGNPLAGASVSSSAQLAVQTDTQGTYVINGVVAGNVTVTASAPGFNTKSQPADVVAGATTVVDVALTPTFSDLGLALDGSVGTPLLVGEGTLESQFLVSLSLSNAKPFALAPLVVGLSSLSAPFKGGVLVPNPNFILPAFTDFFGKSSFGGLWPPGVPSGFTTYFQWWVQDPAGPHGYAASNALAATTP